MNGIIASIVVLGATLALGTLIIKTPLAEKATTAGAGMLYQASQAMLQTAGSPAAYRISFNR